MRKVIVLLAVVLCVLVGVAISRAGEREELQAKMISILQEERAINAEFQLYQIKIKELQDRFPELKKEKEDLAKKLNVIDEAAKKKAEGEKKTDKK